MIGPPDRGKEGGHDGQSWPPKSSDQLNDSAIHPGEIKRDTWIERRSIVLRDYQLAAVNAVLEHLKQYRSTAIAMPTGSGKTPVFCEIARRLNRRTLILAHRQELLSQAAQKLAHLGLPAIVEQAASRASFDHEFVVGSVQSLQRARLQRFPSDHFGLIIIDECHHAPAQSYRNIISHFSGAQVLGVSATFQRLDELGYEGIFDSIAFEISLKEMVTAGYLCPIKAKTLPIKIDLRKVKKVAGDFNQAQLAEAIGQELERAADAVAEHASDRRTLVFLPSVAHAEVFAGLCQDRGINADFVTGSCRDREQKVSAFASGKTRLLTNCMLLTEGFDCPECDCVVMLRPTQSQGLYCQMVGRGTRSHSGKQNLLLLDFLWLTRGNDLCKPASLLGSHATATEKREINQLIDSGEALVDIFDKSQTDSLRAALRARAIDKGEDFDPLADVPDDPLDVDALRFKTTIYAPPATPRQIEALVNMGIRRSQISCRYAASKIFELINIRRSRGLATVKQARRLKQIGIKSPWRVSFADAKRLISDFYASKEPREEVAAV
jgi:superfamily II DNA or RNA helicase